MENKKIVLEYIHIASLKVDNPIIRAMRMTKKLEDEINKLCPEGYKYKETISFVNVGNYRNLDAIVAYEQIPR